MLDRYVHWMAAFKEKIDANEAELTDLDRQIGDADHGSNMVRGVQAVAELDASAIPDAGMYLKKAGMALVSKVGGASGPLYGTLLMKMGGALGANADDVPSKETFFAALRAGVEGVQARGKASVGDKTMLDVWFPALEAGEAAGDSLADALAAAVEAARNGAEATIPMVARKGRASYLGERSAGVKDPGSASSVLLIEAAAEAFGA
ncbi:dihydroxyacetone kinase subunit DhaL [Trueperella bialowiezensis]|uniref:PTS-dependent dihydroxyacetone kinase, ADP-binding subunit dhaL n=1 Tax=Trueperella bialowiezensis TaxID=312285 RepID=A0A448PFD1_9ACTO|nr:dihydroxyacetone kinase subunit DhaL [Trueperella bialowiezensis]VEI13661.1 PTS-dependent dihydroxyacetone kinase, ADP-binding subunit dhaL [Trueperella bialowiezensis]